MLEQPGDWWTVARAQAELPEDARWEIDEGRLEAREPPGIYHAEVELAVGSRLRTFVLEHHLGRVVCGDPGIWLGQRPDTLRAPDVAFYSTARWNAIADKHGFAEVPPDLVVEVRSPTDRPAPMRRKVEQYLAAGVRSVWLLDPRHRRLERWCGSDGPCVHDRDGDVVTDPVLPAFACTLAELLPEP